MIASLFRVGTDIPDGIDSKQLEEWRSPILSLSVINDKWKILHRFDKNKISDTSDYGAWDKMSLNNPVDAYAWQGQIDKPDPEHWWEGPLDVGKWVKWVYHVKYAVDDTAFLEVWKDGIKVIDRHNINVGFNDNMGPTFKFGIYRSHPYSGGVYRDRIMWHNCSTIGDKDCNLTQIMSYLE